MEFKSFSFEPRNKEKFLVYSRVPGILEIANKPSTLSLSFHLSTPSAPYTAGAWELETASV